MEDRKISIFCVIVLYNKHLEESETFVSIRNASGISIIVCDNSTHDMGNREAAERNGCRYICMGGNKGLSKAYNRAIDSLKGKDGILCLFDDDTKIASDYFSKLKEHLKEKMSEIFLPIVMDGTGILSPCAVHGIYPLRVKNLDELKGKPFSGINSGMAIWLNVFRNYRYDENLFLDFVDHAFIRDMRRQNRKIRIMPDIILYQNFSAANNSCDAAESRFKILKKDLRYYCRENFFSRLCGFYIIIKRKIKLSIQFGKIFSV